MAVIDLTGGLPDAWDLAVAEPSGDDAAFGENHALWLWDDERSLGLYLYVKTLEHLGDYAVRRATITVHLPDGSVLFAETDARARVEPASIGVGGVLVQCSEPFRRWRYAFDGAVQASTAAELRAGLVAAAPGIDLSFDVEGVMALPPVVTGSMSEGEANEQARTFYGARRYEQFVRATGTIAVAGVEHRLEAVGSRTHRVGSRSLAAFPGHAWMMGLFPSGRAFSQQRFCAADGVATWEEGYVSDGVRFHPARCSAITLYAGELPGEALTLELTSPLGEHSITGTLRATSFATRSVADPDRFFWGLDTADPRSLVMPRGFAAYRWDDEDGAGLVERSARPAIT